MSQPFDLEGADRAEYGVQTLNRLSAALGRSSARDFPSVALSSSDASTCSSRKTPAKSRKPQTRSALPQTSPAEFPAVGKALSPVRRSVPIALLQDLALSWSRYATFLPVTDPKPRFHHIFHHIEATENRWSPREPRRQIDSVLHERLALACGKGEILCLACKGQVVEKASDPIKDPVGLRSRQHCASECQLYLPSREELC